MTDDEKQETSEATPTGPDAGEESSSSQAAGEDPTPTPPVDEASEPEAAEAGDESPSTPPAEEASESSDADAEEPAAEDSDESPAEPVAEEAPAAEADADDSDEAEEDEQPEAEADEEPAAEAEEKPEEKKKDIIPGADLEPIAVESDGEKLSTEERARREAEEEERARREAELAGEAEEEPSVASRAPAKMESDSRYLATGKRKCSIARVTLLPGSGKIEVNKRSLEEFFPRPLHQTMARQPLATTGYEGSVDVRIRVHGGGISGQAGAVRHGIARALTEIDPELRGELKRRGYLTRDARVKERRKAGLKKARKKPQFSKR
jgi:small subunit ribosomal protein S9